MRRLAAKGHNVAMVLGSRHKDLVEKRRKSVGSFGLFLPFESDLFEDNNKNDSKSYTMREKVVSYFG